MDHPPFDVWLDEERQIVRQRMFCEPNLADFKALIDETEKCAGQLRDPSNVRILVDGEGFGRMKRPVRALAIDTFRTKPVTRMAIVNRHPVARVVIRFVHTVTGIDKMRVFENETEGIKWLLS